MSLEYTSNATGPFDARYLAFLETVSRLRPSLHRYCARMTGSVMDGEDVVQEALFQAYRKLDTFEDGRPLGPWLFKIAHNRCLDFLRRRSVRDRAEQAVDAPTSVPPVDPHGREVTRAVEHLVLHLPPKERACVLLKDVLDYSLEEIAELVDSTVGGVKSALNRGRAKLASSAALPERSRSMSEESSQLLRLYVDRFNQRDWDALRELIAADARLVVCDRFSGRLEDSPYFGRYARVKAPWKLSIGDVDGEPAIVCLQETSGTWTPIAIIRVDIADGRIRHISDYTHCPWLLPAAQTIDLTNRRLDESHS